MTQRSIENEILLKKTFLDKQIISTSGYKLVRVNDLQFLIDNSSKENPEPLARAHRYRLQRTAAATRLGECRQSNFQLVLCTGDQRQVPDVEERATDDGYQRQRICGPESRIPRNCPPFSRQIWRTSSKISAPMNEHRSSSPSAPPPPQRHFRKCR